MYKYKHSGISRPSP